MIGEKLLRGQGTGNRPVKSISRRKAFTSFIFIHSQTKQQQNQATLGEVLYENAFLFIKVYRFNIVK